MPTIHEREQMATIPTEMPYTFAEVSSCKDKPHELAGDWKNLQTFDGLTNPRKFCGNTIIYYFQFKNMLKCRRDSKGYKTLEEWFTDPELKEELWRDTVHRNRREKAPYPNPTDVYECHRLNKGAIVAFKSSTAKYIYTLFGAQNVLDPTAGWGGRMLGASSMGIHYTGIDTNTEMIDAYRGMRDHGYAENCEMIWKSCLDVDFSAKPYDLVLTSTPYANMELYEHMTPWESDDAFYRDFMLPLMEKLFRETTCPICMNMSPKMYKALTTKYQHPPCEKQIDLRQQLGKQLKTKSQDYIYVWRVLEDS